MKNLFLSLMIFLILLLASCQAAEPAPTVEPAPAAEDPASEALPETSAEPTDVPAAEPTAEPTAAAVAVAEPDYLQPRYEPLPPDKCFVYPPEDVEITVAYDCGYVVVPEFYEGETTRIVKVPFLRFNSPNGTNTSPVLLHPGGPGQSHINELAFSVFNIMFNDVIADRDVIFMDPRGTEHADTFLDCPAFYSLKWQAYQEGLDQEATEALAAETLQNCIDDFKAQGVNLEAYNSLELAGDVNSVRQAFGYEQIIYFGTSYGSILGQHLMREYPEILEAVILNGSSPLSRESWIEDRALDNQAAFDNLVAMCSDDERCNAAYPDIPGLMDGALAHFQDGPIPYSYSDPNDPSLTLEGEVDASTLAALVLSSMGNKNSVFTVPATIASLAPPDQTEAVVTLLGQALGQSIVSSRDMTKGEEAFLMHLAVVCSDDMVRSEDEIILDGASEFAIDAARSEAAPYVAFCPLLDVKEMPEGTDENVTADIPTLLLSGSLDVATPPVRSQLIADALPNATHVIFPGHTHDQLGSLSPCVKDVFSQFIADPSTAPDTSCVETPDYIGFLLPDGSFSLDSAEEAMPTADTEQAEAGAASTLPEDLTAQLDAYLQSQVYTDGGDPALAAPGLVLYVETAEGRYLNAAGVANLADGAPVEADDRLEIGSNTKSMTIVLLMQLVEEGLISLDDLLSQYLPEEAALLPNGDQMTIRQLAQHTAGVYDYGDNIIAAGIGDPEALEAAFTPAELVQDAADNGSPYFAPGQEGQWHYSNTGYVLLGMIIESVTGEAVADLYQTRIFDPLGMESAIFLEGVPQPGDIDSRGYWWTADGEIVDTTNWNGSQGWVAGAAAMTAEDLAMYAKALAAGELFQNPDTVNEMLVFDERAKLSIGGPYGLGLIDFAGDGTVWGHGGQTPGFQSLWYVQPQTGTVVVGLTNSAAYGANAFLNVLNILDGKGAQPFSSWTLTPLGDFVGTTWTWKKFNNPVEAVDIAETADLSIVIGRDGAVTVGSAACGEAYGTYSSTGIGNISFDMDNSSWTCADDSPAGRFVDYLSQATSWSFNNGSLLVELPADGGTMVFANVPLQ
jgi:D-alanyl-D-alanine carboxypeptidase